MQRLGSPMPLAGAPASRALCAAPSAAAQHAPWVTPAAEDRDHPLKKPSHSRERFSMELISIRSERIIQPVEGRTQINMKAR